MISSWGPGWTGLGYNHFNFEVIMGSVVKKRRKKMSKHKKRKMMKRQRHKS
jgi:hypothetical protein